jgi:hypothetical protein
MLAEHVFAEAVLEHAQVLRDPLTGALLAKQPESDLEPIL